MVWYNPLSWGNNGEDEEYTVSKIKVDPMNFDDLNNQSNKIKELAKTNFDWIKNMIEFVSKVDQLPRIQKENLQSFIVENKLTNKLNDSFAKESIILESNQNTKGYVKKNILDLQGKIMENISKSYNLRNEITQLLISNINDKETIIQKNIELHKLLGTLIENIYEYLSEVKRLISKVNQISTLYEKHYTPIINKFLESTQKNKYELLSDEDRAWAERIYNRINNFLNEYEYSGSNNEQRATLIKAKEITKTVIDHFNKNPNVKIDQIKKNAELKYAYENNDFENTARLLNERLPENRSHLNRVRLFMESEKEHQGGVKLYGLVANIENHIPKRKYTNNPIENYFNMINDIWTNGLIPKEFNDINLGKNLNAPKLKTIECFGLRNRKVFPTSRDGIKANIVWQSSLFHEEIPFYVVIDLRKIPCLFNYNLEMIQLVKFDNFADKNKIKIYLNSNYKFAAELRQLITKNNITFFESNLF